MSNTIELLEAIGKDASLRHATGENLAEMLAGLQASEWLERAARLGDSRHLAQDLSLRAVQISNHVVQAPVPQQEEEVEEQDEDAEDDSEAAKP